MMEGKSDKEIVNDCGPDLGLKRKRLSEIDEDICSDNEIKRPKNECTDLELNDWQKETLQRLDEQNSRQLLFVVLILVMLNLG